MVSDDFRDQLIELTPKLRAYAMSLTRARHWADDLVQDTLERAWRARANFRPESDLRIWLFTILRNRFTDGYRRQRHTIQDVDGEHAIRMSSPAEQSWRLQYGDLLAAIERLPPDSRSALVLISGAGLTFEEAAKVCGCPVSTVKSRVQRARRLLMEFVDIAPARKTRRPPKDKDTASAETPSAEAPLQ
ncbi:RNA polymerase sigma factor [soil metagenome]